MEITKVYETIDTIYYSIVTSDEIIEMTVLIRDAVIYVVPTMTLPYSIELEVRNKCFQVARTNVREIIQLTEMNYHIPEKLKMWLDREQFPLGECPMYDLLCSKLDKLVKSKAEYSEHSAMWKKYCSKNFTQIEESGDSLKLEMMINHYDECLPMSEKWMDMSDQEKEVNLNLELDDYFNA